jgi:hypothetical protein
MAWIAEGVEQFESQQMLLAEHMHLSWLAFWAYSAYINDGAYFAQGRSQ